MLWQTWYLDAVLCAAGEADRGQPAGEALASHPVCNQVCNKACTQAQQPGWFSCGTEVASSCAALQRGAPASEVQQQPCPDVKELGDCKRTLIDAMNEINLCISRAKTAAIFPHDLYQFYA